MNRANMGPIGWIVDRLPNVLRSDFRIDVWRGSRSAVCGQRGGQLGSPQRLGRYRHLQCRALARRRKPRPKQSNADEERQNHGDNERGLPQPGRTRLLQIVNDVLKHRFASTCRGRQRMRASSISTTTRSEALWSWRSPSLFLHAQSLDRQRLFGKPASTFPGNALTANDAN
jgi:hypothetical protein